ncbi:hypothetical protein [Actinomadura sp. WMMA1423]|uniref:hypothetical protein n=1 Tax=Actinomadura sp. WMMA1423 TaxID=2591108 RepID=UPI0011475272|nr:hypothetical protein [Actinomadura sp. WMMA1423]
MSPYDRRLVAVVFALAFALILIAAAVDGGPASVGATVSTGVTASALILARRSVRRDRRTGSRSIFRAEWGRRLRGCGARHRKVADGRLVRVAAAVMAPPARRRWLEDVEVTLYDFAPERHQALLHDFLAHAPAVIVAGWAAWAGELPRALAGIRHRPSGSD